MDVVTANSEGSSVSVLLNNGYNLDPNHDYGTGNRPLDVAVGDLNGDGAPDVATADSDPNTVSLLLNDGSGGFGASHPYSVGTTPTSLAIADVNGDSKPDVTVADSEDGSLSVLLNKGGGNLDVRRDYRAGDGPKSLAVADLNADGKLDLAAVNGYDATVSVLVHKPGVCDVQNVAGATVRSAKATLKRFNCRVGKVTRRYSKSVRRGRVISQKPGFGGVLPGGGKVKLVVSLGRKR